MATNHANDSTKSMPSNQKIKNGIREQTIIKKEKEPNRIEFTPTILLGENPPKKYTLLILKARDT